MADKDNFFQFDNDDSVAKNSVSDISPLANLTKLGFLTLSGNNITDISVMANMPDLYRVILLNNMVTDISPLTTMKTNATLYLDQPCHVQVNENCITDFSPLDHLTSICNVEGAVYELQFMEDGGCGERPVDETDADQEPEETPDNETNDHDA